MYEHAASAASLYDSDIVEGRHSLYQQQAEGTSRQEKLDRGLVGTTGMASGTSEKLYDKTLCNSDKKHLSTFVRLGLLGPNNAEHNLLNTFSTYALLLDFGLPFTSHREAIQTAGRRAHTFVSVRCE